jgi:hypothetical protein
MSAQNTSTLTDEPLSPRARATLDASQARGAATGGPGDVGHPPALPPDKPGDKEIAASTPATHRSAGAPGQHERPLRFLIVGAGAVGGLIAARLAGSGYHVTVLALPRSAARLREDGLRIASGDGTSVLRPTVVTAGELTSGYDAIVLAVKSDGLDGAMADIEPAVKPPTVIIPFLNGMAHVEALTGRFGPNSRSSWGNSTARRAPVSTGSRRPSRTPGQTSPCPGTSSMRCGPNGCSSPASAPSPR